MVVRCGFIGVLLLAKSLPTGTVFRVSPLIGLVFWDSWTVGNAHSSIQEYSWRKVPLTVVFLYWSEIRLLGTTWTYLFSSRCDSENRRPANDDCFPPGPAGLRLNFACSSQRSPLVCFSVVFSFSAGDWLRPNGCDHKLGAGKQG